MCGVSAPGGGRRRGLEPQRCCVPRDKLLHFPVLTFPYWHTGTMALRQMQTPGEQEFLLIFCSVFRQQHITGAQ